MRRRTRKATGSNDDVVEWIRSIIRKRDWTATELARRSGLAPSTLLRALNDPDYLFSFSSTTLRKIATGAGEPVPRDLAGGAEHGIGVPAIAGSTDQPASGYRMLEVRSVSALPAKAQSAVKSGKPELIAAPPYMENDATAFAFRNPDESLGSWYKPRSVMFATKARDPTGGDIVMITRRDGRTRVRLLLGIDETGLSLSRSMPAKEDEKIPFDEIRDIAIIVGTMTG